MHQGVQINRLAIGRFVEWVLVSCVDRIRTEIDNVRTVTPIEYLAQMLRHPEIFHQRPEVASLVRRECGSYDDCVGFPEESYEGSYGRWFGQIDSWTPNGFDDNAVV